MQKSIPFNHWRHKVQGYYIYSTTTYVYTVAGMLKHLYIIQSLEIATAATSGISHWNTRSTPSPANRILQLLRAQQQGRYIHCSKIEVEIALPSCVHRISLLKNHINGCPLPLWIATHTAILRNKSCFATTQRYLTEDLYTMTTNSKNQNVQNQKMQ